MLQLVLDENISHVIATQVTSRRPEIGSQSILHWRAGTLLNKPDAEVLRAAAEDGLTMVTYDLRTIPTLITAWAMSGISHAGIMYVDERTIRPEDFGRLVRALEQLWDREHDQDWTNRTDFLERA